jgi:hypothetical protein
MCQNDVEKKFFEAKGGKKFSTSSGHIYILLPAIHTTLFRVTHDCACVGHMQAMCQSSFHNLGILCQ